MEAYHIVDEPGAAAFAGLGRLVAYLRQRDPGHLAYINLFPTYANEQQLGITAASVKNPEAGIRPAGRESSRGTRWSSRIASICGSLSRRLSRI